MVLFNGTNLGKKKYIYVDKYISLSLLQLKGSRLDLYDGKVFSSLESQLKLMLPKFKFLYCLKIF